MQATPESVSAYEPPHLTTVGSVRDLTLGRGLWGGDDTFVFTWGPFHIETSYGELS